MAGKKFRLISAHMTKIRLTTNIFGWNTAEVWHTTQ